MENMVEIIIAGADFKKLGVKTLIIGIYQKAELSQAVKQFDSSYEGIISGALKNNFFSGEKAVQKSLYIGKNGLVSAVLVGLGEESKATLESISDALATAVRTQKEQSNAPLGIYLDSFITRRFSEEILIEKIGVSIVLGLYQFTEFKTKDKDRQKNAGEITVISSQQKKYAEFLDKGCVVGKAVTKTRTLANTPPNIASPEYLASYCTALAREIKLKCTVFNEPELKKMNMNCFLAVAQGSSQKPKLVILEYHNGGKKDPVVLVGKGITFDSGGLNVKPADGMAGMKHDKAGACSVIHVIEAAARLKLPLNIIAMAPLCENMPSATSYRPDDIITSYAGITVEIKNTDAEGRMILADTLAYAVTFKPQAIIDVATLTGASRIVLGSYGTPILGNSEHIISRIKNAATKSGEKVWELPLWPEYEDDLKSDAADIKHLGENGSAGTIIGGVFLKQFVKETPWAHLDIATTSTAKAEKGIFSKGATGVSVRLLIELLRNWH